MRRLLPFVLLLLILPTAAQVPTWEVVMVDPAATTLYYVTPDGTTAIALPENVSQLGETVDVIDISVDKSHIALLADGVLYFANLAGGMCCQLVQGDIGARIWAQSGGFHTDGGLYAISAERSDIETPLEAVFAVIDVKTAAIVHIEQMPAPNFARVAMGGWQGDSVLYLPALECGRPSPLCGLGDYRALVFDPETRRPIETISVDFGLPQNGVTLPLTGEVVQAIEDPAFPAVEAMPVNAPNTLVYIADGQRTLIHRDPRNPVAPRQLHWVADGNAILAEGVLIWRDGTRFRFEEGQPRIIAGTPDGWLAQDQIDDRWTALVHVTAGKNGLETRNIGGVAAASRVISRPVLGTGLPVPPPRFVPIDDPDRVLACPGSPPPRLTAWLADAVTLAGFAHTIWRSPNTDDDTLATLPAGTRLQVLDGPRCGENATWWFVSDGNERGWIPEIRSGKYQLEALP